MIDIVLTFLPNKSKNQKDKFLPSNREWFILILVEELKGFDLPKDLQQEIQLD